jgi:hypothetical protein
VDAERTVVRSGDDFTERFAHAIGIAFILGRLSGIASVWGTTIGATIVSAWE